MQSKVFMTSITRKRSHTIDQIVENRKQEFQIANCINHPNIAKAYFMWMTSQKKVKIASEYLPWSDLHNLLSKYKSVKWTRGLPVELVRFYAVEIIKALSYMRDNKILHRDIKPENIMLDHTFHIKLIGFGFGVRYDEDNKSSTQSRTYIKCSEVKNKTGELLEEVEKIKNKLLM